MNRDEAIRIIETLYPVDSEYEDTAKIGQELLAQAKRDVSAWKQESDEVLRRYAYLCVQRERDAPHPARKNPPDQIHRSRSEDQ